MHMNWSRAHIFTLREAPADAEIPSHKLLIRGGYIKKLAPGLFVYQHLALRVIRKLEKIIRDELDQRGCTEILMPMVQPREIWDETGRWEQMGDGLQKFKNRNGHEFCLGPTHEEVITDLVRHDIRSYRDLPRNLYQIQGKFRDEIRPRFGLMRGREFVMKDAYSFDLDQEKAHDSYKLMYEAYQAIFDRVGAEYRIVEADTGAIGGNLSHEFQVLAEAGEDHLLVCDKCDYAANIEVAPAIDPGAESTDELQVMEKFETPNQKTIAELSQFTSVPENQLVKTLFYEAPEGRPVAVLLRGDDEANPIKIKNHFGMADEPLLLTDAEILKVSGANPGSCGPVGLKIPVYADAGIKGFKNMIVGANEDGYHLKNVNFERDFKTPEFADFRTAKAGESCPKCKDGKYKSVRGIEVGQVFYLGTKYSKAMEASYLDANGKKQAIEMGCYGIGVSRTMQAVVEHSHDKDGIIWPLHLAPFEVHVCVLDPDDEKIQQTAQSILSGLEELGLAVLVDDRKERPGVKFKDADLLGMPYRINIGRRGVDNNEIDIVERKTKDAQKVAIDQVVGEIKKRIENA
jgi:prolyl-tRNA synthetase